MTNWADFDIEESTRFNDIDDMMQMPDVPANEPDKPDASLLDSPKRKRNAVTYEKQVKKLFGKITRICFTRTETVPDAAAFLMYGPKVSKAFGDLAAEYDVIGNFIDGADTITDSPILNLVGSVLPLASQLVRNHEPVLEPKKREFKIPRSKYALKLPKMGIKLGVARGFTDDPDLLVRHVLTDPDVQKALAKNGINLIDGS